MRVLIVDDEPLGRRRIRQLLDREPDADVVGECTNGTEAVAALRATAPDVVFLDVQMPAMDGFEVLAAVGGVPLPVVVFVTAYDRYALRAFEVHALDYLLKPFDRERFYEALDRAREHLRRQNLDVLNRRLQALLADVPAAETTDDRYPDRLAVKSTGRVVLLDVAAIDWAEAAGNYVRLHVGTKEHLLRETMTGLEAQLDPEQFLRIHRSTIVNRARVRSIHPHPNGEYELRLADGTSLASSRSYRDRVQAMRDGPF